REQCRLDGGPLPIRPEVRAKTRPQVTRASDVQHLVLAITEEVDAGRRRRPDRERSLRVPLAYSRRGQVDEIGDGAGAAFLRKPDQLHEDLGGRLSVRQGAVTRARSSAEELRKRPETRAACSSGQETSC